MRTDMTIAQQHEVIAIKKTTLKERISVSIEPELLEWLDAKVQDKIFANRSHGMEFLLKQQADRDIVC